MLNAKKVLKTDSCWLWLGAKTPNGYGQSWDGKAVRLAHRLSFEHTYGPIPEGLQIDHICRVKHCINPEHLRIATNRENQLGGTSPTALNAKKTACKYGHLFTPENTIILKGRFQSRHCRTCKQRNDRMRRLKKKKDWLERDPRREGEEGR